VRLEKKIHELKMAAGPGEKGIRRKKRAPVSRWLKLLICCHSVESLEKKGGETIGQSGLVQQKKKPSRKKRHGCLRREKGGNTLFTEGGFLGKKRRKRSIGGARGKPNSPA